MVFDNTLIIYYDCFGAAFIWTCYISESQKEISKQKNCTPDQFLCLGVLVIGQLLATFHSCGVPQSWFRDWMCTESQRWLKHQDVKKMSLFVSVEIKSSKPKCERSELWNYPPIFFKFYEFMIIFLLSIVECCQVNSFEVYLTSNVQIFLPRRKK